MGMYMLLGEVINVFNTPEKVNQKTGEVRDAAFRIQVMGEDELENGDKKLSLVDLKVADVALYSGLKGKRILQPIGIMVDYNARRQVVYATKGSKPRVMASDKA